MWPTKYIGNINKKTGLGKENSSTNGLGVNNVAISTIKKRMNKRVLKNVTNKFEITANKIVRSSTTKV